MAEQTGISNNFYKNLITLASIVVGVLYIENHITSTIKEAVTPISNDVTSHGVRINNLEQKSSLNDYRWDIYENQIKEFIKPEEAKIKAKK